jgi:hypothetical protein
MAILRDFNVLGQMRWDVPHQRLIESAVRGDIDLLAGKILTGTQPLVVRGFTIPTTNTVGTSVNDLQLTVAGGILMHFGATENGTLFMVSDCDTSELLNANNPKVIGSFTAGVTNYVGLDLRRTADTNSSDLVAFLDAETDTEFGQTVPLARTLKYRIVISTQNFTTSSNILPIARIVTSSTNTVVSIQDARRMMFRLGTGGDNPSATVDYAWGTRTENPITYSGGADPFSGEDKGITNFKSWMDSIMTSIWEVRGGEHWYSATNRDNVKVLYGSVSTLTDNWEFAANTLKWESLKLAFENADGTGIYYNTIANNTSGVTFNTDGMCLYVDVQRESNATNIPAVVGTLQTLGSPTIAGRRIVLAWRQGGEVYTRDRPYEIGRALAVATTTTVGVVKLSRAATTPTSPIVISDTGGTITPGNTAGLTISAPSSGNNYGLIVTGKGTSDGVLATGGDSSGDGVTGVGGATGGRGVVGGGTGTGSGVYGIGDGSDNGIGVEGQGTGTEPGVKGTGSATVDSANGVEGYGGAGVSTSGHGVVGQGGGGNDNGGTGGVFTGGDGSVTNGDGVHGTGSSAGGTGGVFTGGGGDGNGVEGIGQGAGRYGGVFSSDQGTDVDVVNSVGYINLDDATNPASTDPFTNKLTPLNTPKAWGVVTTDGGGNATIENGFNVNTATIVGTTDVKIKLKDGTGDTDHTKIAVLVTPVYDGTNGVMPSVSGITASATSGNTEFTVSLYLLNPTGPTITIADVSTIVYRFHFVVYMVQ